MAIEFIWKVSDEFQLNFQMNFQFSFKLEYMPAC